MINSTGADLVRFPRGFVWSRDGREGPKHYINVKLAGLAVAPNTIVAEASDGPNHVTVLGMCIAVTATGKADVAAALLEQAAVSDNALFDYLDSLCGKYVIFLKQGERLRVFHDAGATRVVYYRRDFTAIASHARLVTNLEASPLPFGGSYHGNGTPFHDVKILFANNYLDLLSGKSVRYWPRGPLPTYSVDDAAEIILDLALSAVKGLPEGSDVRASLTAGLDSRTSLAVLRKSGVPFSTYTYRTTAKADIAMGFELARIFRLTHTLVDTPKADPDLKSALDEASYYRSTAHSVMGLRSHFDKPKPVAIISNLLEIGQGYYQKLKNKESPDSPEAMQRLYMSTGIRRRPDVIAYSVDKLMAEGLPFFEDVFEDTDFKSAMNYVSAFDLFYWEHRMSSWHSNQMLERDFFTEGFVIFNSRLALQASLGVPLQDRLECNVFRKIMRICDERYLSLPFNPVDMEFLTNDL